ncbi:hypothetical protein SAT01_27580 [Sinomonas atrocyanea]|nr:hypothetical protein SAT01_27580 [Sinomonas atrocyanea]GGG59350.1 hypothetical protein GCM10007172_07770 [Sinomonas atrocyanea]
MSAAPMGPEGLSRTGALDKCPRSATKPLLSSSRGTGTAKAARTAGGRTALPGRDAKGKSSWCGAGAAPTGLTQPEFPRERRG